MWDQPRPRAPRRRRLLVLGGFCALVAVLLGVAGGAARSTYDAADQAAQLRSRGEFGQAAALYLQIARRSSFLYLFAHGVVAGAPGDEQATLLAWAEDLAAHGHLDQALRLAAGITDPSLLSTATRERATLLLAAARAAASAGSFQAAVLRITQLQRLTPPASLAAQAAALLPQYEVGEARSLIATGDGADAVAILDSVPAPAASSTLPEALLAAGRQELAELSYLEATATLRRLVDSYGDSPAAAAARSLLGRREPVAGSLTTRAGAPVSGEVRLSSNFQNLGSSYLTSGPFFYSNADQSGDFVLEGVPQGGPYVLEVFHGGDWTTLIDPSTGRPANPVTVDGLAPVDLTFIVLPS